MAHLGWTKPGFFGAPEDEVVLQHAIARYHAYVSLSSSSDSFVCLRFLFRSYAALISHCVTVADSCTMVRFLDLMSSSPASFFVPTLDIDLVWHTHQLMNVQYETDCKRYVGRFIDQCVIMNF